MELEPANYKHRHHLNLWNSRNWRFTVFYYK